MSTRQNWLGFAGVCLLVFTPRLLAADKAVSLPNPGFEVDENGDGLPDGWDMETKASRLDPATKHSGRYSLFAKGTVKLTEPIRVKPDTGYCLRIWAKRDERGLTRVRICDPAGRAIALCDNGCGYEMTAYSSEFDWKELPLGFRTGQHDQILLELEAKGASRSVWFDDIEFVEDDSIRVGDVTPIEPALEFSAAEKERGYVVFSRHYLERTFQTSVPKPEEITNGVRCRASLDEYEPISVMVRSLKNLTALNAQIREPLVGPQGATIPASEIDVRMVRPSRRWLNSVGYVELPLFLPLAVPDDLPADQTRQFWITVHVPEDAVPGLYRGVIEIFA